MTINKNEIIENIREATRAIQLATNEIVILREQLEVARKENERLRARLAVQSARLRLIENGEL